MYTYIVNNTYVRNKWYKNNYLLGSYCGTIVLALGFRINMLIIQIDYNRIVM